MKSQGAFMSVEANGSVGKLLTALRGKNGGVVQLWHKPSGKPSSVQLARRAIFSSARDAWNALTDEQKQSYNVLGDSNPRNRMTGYNYFLSQNLNSVVSDSLLLETGDKLLLETGDFLLLE